MRHLGLKIKQDSRKPIGWLMFIIGTLASFYFASVILRASIDLGLLAPFLGSIALAIAGWLRAKRPAPVLSKRAQRVRNAVYIALFLWFASFLTVEGVIVKASHRLPSGHADYVLVLGAGIWGDRLPPLLQNRMDCALTYLDKHPSCSIIVSGGRGRGEAISEAEAMKRYLEKHGIDGERIIKEEASGSTFENIKNTRTILLAKGQGQSSVLVVTNDFHIFRTMMLAKRLGMNAEGLPCKTRLIDVPHSYTREYFALCKSWAMDV